jgi:outer membrane lipoprotein SlyB
MKKHSIVTILMTALLLLPVPMMNGCASKVGGSDYATSGAQQAYRVEYGTVTSVRPVKIHEGQSGTVVGAVGGGVVGGVLGSMVGGGKGNTLATLGGALAGATVGGAAGNAIGNQDGVEVTVQLDSGTIMTIVQGADMVFTPGQRVKVLSGDGKTRVSHL